ncbi:MAG TPA: NAD-glutamate dehydrogenase domain-containing protein [Acidimicrobiales bacterium]|jgi:glutamate dehydrogenase|nr:NAD-glutamate dehydrogenase domain-containing protein [Acidimicrobiales bacterium]
MTGGTWVEQLGAVLASEGHGGPADAEAFAARVPAGYRERTPVEEAAADLVELGSLVAASPAAHRAPTATSGRQRFAVRPAPVDGTFRLRRYGENPVELSSFLPVVESFGISVLEAVPHRVPDIGGVVVHLDDFGLRAEPPAIVDALSDGPRLVAALHGVLGGEADVDSLNRLVIAAGVGWREVGILRAYRRYRRQAGSALSDLGLADPLVAFPDVARALLGYFGARFDPDGDGPAGPTAVAARGAVVDALAAVTLLEQDQALRGYLALIDATVRTNWFRRDPAPPEGSGGHRPTLALKFDSTLVPELQPPRPRWETFVYAPVVEGVHLRAGPVARGGIRWSDRGDDLRSEVLDLAAAQVKKNAIIVPTGAKGGFVCRAGCDPRDAYSMFVAALLDVTDNLVGGVAVAPAGVVCADGDDPYLVVAADRGTATYSDLANEISERAGYWLGDAFASGGSSGYDHKAMGITARGAWKAVERHFRQLGMDVRSDPLRVAGVGDMSGDVFGNGMIRSRAIRLVAAFDHRHVFVDPDPDPESSFAERVRLASLPRSSWDDYDRDLLSPGGGVWPRDTARIDLAPEAAAALGTSEPSMSPLGLISVILGAHVDLLWFGGIGTYIKAPTETDADIGDHANDAVRITADHVRARVIAEGGNLGVTQRARIRYSRRGGRINTDFIDNAAGVATSDREVNLKILLRLAMDEGRLDMAGRDKLLQAVEGDVASEVLRQVDHSVAALTRAVPDSADDLAAYVALMDVLEGRAQLDRAVEALPDADELGVRATAGAGLIRPELAVLLAYAKTDLVAAVVSSPLVDDGSFTEAVGSYFPDAVRALTGDLIRRHRLYRELAATGLAGAIVDQMGITWAHELAAEMGVSLPEVAGCWWAAWQVLGAERAFEELEQVAGTITVDAEDELHRTLAAAVGALARAYLLDGSGTPPSRRVADDGPLVGHVGSGSGGGRPTEHEALDPGPSGPGEGAHRSREPLVAWARAWAERARVADIGPVARTTARAVPAVSAALRELDGSSGVADLIERIRGSDMHGRWARWHARALIDDLHRFRRHAAAAALRSAPEAAPGEAVARWMAGHERAVTRARGAAAAPLPAGDDQLAMAALAVRFLTGGT